jgi:hypothetical protein
LIGGLIALAGILPPLISDLSATAAEKQIASEIYVSQRIAHHLNFAAFPIWHISRFAILVVFWGLLYVWLKDRLLDNPVVFHRKLEPLQDFAAGALVISFFGLILSGLADSGSTFSTGLLKFYWFRLADFAVPASISLASCFVIAFWLELENDVFRRASSVVFTVCVFLAAVLLFVQRHELQMPNADVRSLPQYPENETRFRESFQNWKKVCDWIADNTPADAAFITPHQQQTFKWYASRTEGVSWKDIPQDAKSMVQWQERLERIQEPQQFMAMQLLTFNDDRLERLANEYGATYILLPQAVYDLACSDPKFGKPRFERVYPKANEKATWVVLKF